MFNFLIAKNLILQQVLPARARQIALVLFHLAKRFSIGMHAGSVARFQLWNLSVRTLHHQRSDISGMHSEA
jgi:hypothetical protein